jgi:hypothetical protein
MKPTICSWSEIERFQKLEEMISPVSKPEKKKRKK